MLNETTAAHDRDGLPALTALNLISPHNLMASAVDLVTVSRIAISITPEVQKELKPGSPAYLLMALLVEHAKRAIAKSEGAL